jgi:hypothetical protein
VPFAVGPVAERVISQHRPAAADGYEKNQKLEHGLTDLTDRTDTEDVLLFMAEFGSS